MSKEQPKPRSKNRVRNPYTFVDMYEDYIADINEDSPYHVTYNEYVSICEDYYKIAMDNVLKKGWRFRLPFRMGDVMVIKKKLKKFDKDHLPIDWELTKKHGHYIYHTNDHSNNYKYRFRWSKKLIRSTPNIGQYRLVLTRANKRALAACIKSGDYDYIEQR